MEFVELRGGLTLPVEILEFALGLEARGVHLQANGDVLKVTSDEGKPILSDDEVAFIRNRKPHLLAVAAYQVPHFSSCFGQQEAQQKSPPQSQQ